MINRKSISFLKALSTILLFGSTGLFLMILLFGFVYGVFVINPLSSPNTTLWIPLLWNLSLPVAVFIIAFYIKSRINRYDETTQTEAA